MVGNMMELNKPIASSEYPETWPLVLAESNSSEMTTAATHDSTLPGEKTRSTYAPMNRPTIAPPQ